MTVKASVLWLLLIALLSNSVALLHASTQPKFTLIPTTATAFLLPANYTQTVQYTVTNKTHITRVLTMKQIAGVTQVTGGAGACAKPFTLTAEQSCLLTLEVHGNAITRINGGPEICKTIGGSNTNPDPFLCSQPSTANTLSVSSVSAGQHAYIVNQAGNSISFCQINQVTGFLENCAITATGLSFPEAIAMNTAGTFLYAANSGNSTISVCQVNSATGALTNCADAGGSGFNTPSGVAVSPDDTILYVSNGAGIAGVSACSINATTGMLSACVNNSSPTFNAPFDMTLNAAGTLAYVVNFSSSTVSICAVNGTTVNNCDDHSGSSIVGPEGITLSPSGLYAYIANNGNNTITVCSIAPNSGLLFACSVTDGPFDGTGNIGINNLGTTAYVPNYISNKVFVCAADVVTGQLSNCKDSQGSGFDTPAGILLR